MAKLKEAGHRFGDALCQCVNLQTKFARHNTKNCGGLVKWMCGGVVQKRWTNLQIDELSLLPSSAQTWQGGPTEYYNMNESILCNVSEMSFWLWQRDLSNNILKTAISGWGKIQMDHLVLWMTYLVSGWWMVILRGRWGGLVEWLTDMHVCERSALLV